MIRNGIYGALALLALYFGTITLISDWAFARSQFVEFWYFIVPLALGFGAQIAVYTRLRNLARGAVHGRGVITVTGTASGAAMLSCCTHYLVSILPVLGATGIVTLASQYQIEFFWIGLAVNGVTFGFSQEYLYNDAIVLTLISIASGVCALIYLKTERQT